MAAGCAPAMTGATVLATAAGARRKWMGTHVVPSGPAAAAIGLVTGAPSTLPVRSAAKTPPIPKKWAMMPMAKVLAVKRPMKKGSLAVMVCR
jgi:hypothetical protein